MSTEIRAAVEMVTAPPRYSTRPYRWRCACGAIYQATRRGYGTCTTCAKRQAIELLRQFVAQHRRAPRAVEIRRSCGLPTRRTIQTYFGSVASWLRVLKLNPRGRGERLQMYRGGSAPASKVKPPRKTMDPAVALYRKELRASRHRRQAEARIIAEARALLTA